MSKIINVCIVYDLYPCPRNPTNNFKFKNCLFGATSVVKISDKEKYVYSGYWITFNSADSWSFDNNIAWNVIIFAVDNSSLCHADNRKNNFLMLAERPAFGINGKFSSLVLISKKQRQNIVWFCIIMLIKAICLLMEKKSLSLKPTIKMLTFQLNFVLEAYKMDLVLLSL